MKIHELLDVEEGEPLAFSFPLDGEQVYGSFEVLYERTRGPATIWRCQGNTRDTRVVQFDLIGLSGGQWRVSNIRIVRR